MLEVTEIADDGSRVYRLTENGEVCKFDITRRGWSWGCDGITFLARPGTYWWRKSATNSEGVTGFEWEVTSWCHEAGWLTWRSGREWARRACLRRVLREARKQIRKRARDRQLRPGRIAALERELLGDE